MKQKKSPIEKAEQRGGGEKTAAPFWAAGLLLTVASLFLSHYLLGTRDTLIDLVPSDAAVYVHAQGEQVDLALQLLPHLDTDTLDEAALFATNDEAGLQWTTLLRWHYPYELTDEELTMLANSGAKSIDERTYATGATDFVLTKDDSSESLAQNKLIAPALASMRSIARVQGYIAVTPVGQTATLIVNGLEDMDSPYVFASTEHKQTNILLVKADEASSWLGLKVPVVKNKANLPALTPPASLKSAISYSLANTEFSLANLLLADIERERLRLGVPDSDELDLAKDELAKLLTGRLALILGTEPTLQGRTRFSLFLPNIELTTLQSAISHLMKVSVPEQNTFVRPDGAEETEFIIGDSPPDYQFESVGSDVILASDQEMLLASLKSIKTKSIEQKRCAPGADSIIYAYNLKFLAEYFPFLGLILDNPQFENVVIQRNGDNYVFFCG